MSAVKKFQWRGKPSAGSIKKPEVEWIGGKRGYLWLGDDEGRCAITMSDAQCRALRDFLTANLEGSSGV